MAPKLSEDEIDDLIYLARVGENDDLNETLTEWSKRENVSRAEILIAARNEGKSTTLHMATGNGHLETVRKLLQCFDGRPLEEKQAFIDEANEHGNTGLHWAALGGHLDAVKLLMEHGASPALANESNYVPLDLANLNDKREVAEYFLASAGMLENKNEESGLANAAESIELTGDDEDKDEAKAA
ncbi:ankyrin repeat-containing protein [Conoideocrella luteorostrata]|uniref:Ankyrin repeat-containing protein n=1 Tax=Conoideocrella luteorostrata TaxID=1105319 RepID=A0AAJ0FXK5_9HYPO|nr:ankyrin repeat-containing protein [Conoideocrella luteorostrata]